MEFVVFVLFIVLTVYFIVGLCFSFWRTSKKSRNRGCRFGQTLTKQRLHSGATNQECRRYLVTACQNHAYQITASFCRTYVGYRLIVLSFYANLWVSIANSRWVIVDAQSSLTLLQRSVHTAHLRTSLSAKRSLKGRKRLPPERKFQSAASAFHRPRSSGAPLQVPKNFRSATPPHSGSI